MTETPVTIKPTDELAEPSHSDQHNQANSSLANLLSRVGALEGAVPNLVEEITQARRVAHEWVVRGPLVSGRNFLLPVLWNLTSRAVQYEAAKMTVYTPPGVTSIKVDIVTGPHVGNGIFDTNQQMTTILSQKLEIAENEHESQFYYATDGAFVGEMPEEYFLAAYIDTVGDADTPGADLTIQLNRLL